VGCCGKKSRGLTEDPIPKGQAVREIVMRPKQPPARLPQPSATVVKISNMTIQPTQNAFCKKCGARLVLKRIWSSRLRQNYSVSWCPGCQKEE
jgi:hypothetical protein